MLSHPGSLFRVSVLRVGDLFDIDNLLPELVVGLGLALLVGNGLAFFNHRRGKTPHGVENPEYRGARVAFLAVVGLLMTAWGTVSLFS
jgi:hypothetical protein